MDFASGEKIGTLFWEIIESREMLEYEEKLRFSFF